MISRPRVPRGRDPGYFLLVQKLDGCFVHPRDLERLFARRKEAQRGRGREGRRKRGGRHMDGGGGVVCVAFCIEH